MTVKIEIDEGPLAPRNYEIDQLIMGLEDAAQIVENQILLTFVQVQTKRGANMVKEATTATFDCRRAAETCLKLAKILKESKGR